MNKPLIEDLKDMRAGLRDSRGLEGTPDEMPALVDEAIAQFEAALSGFRRMREILRIRGKSDLAAEKGFDPGTSIPMIKDQLDRLHRLKALGVATDWGRNSPEPR